MGGHGPLLVVVLLAGCASVPDRELPVEGATAEEVVAAFVDAVDHRDARAVEALASPEHAALVEDTWFGIDISDLDVGDSVPRSPVGSSAQDFDLAVYVPVDLTIADSDVSLPDGRTAWGYLLARNGLQDRWLVVGHGMG